MKTTVLIVLTILAIGFLAMVCAMLWNSLTIWRARRASERLNYERARRVLATKNIFLPLLLLLALPAFGQTNDARWKTKLRDAKDATLRPFTTTNGETFAPGLELTLAGTYTKVRPQGLDRLFTQSAKGGVFGMDLGLLAWPSKYFGIGASAGLADFKRPSAGIVEFANLEAAIRYPIGVFAPYVILSGGRDFNLGRYFVEPGVGGELRITPRAGIFAEARYRSYVDSHGEGALVPRAGLRIAF